VIEPPPSVLGARQQARLLFSAAEVLKAIDQLAVRLTVALAEENPLLISIMNGALPFTASLMQRLHFPLQLSHVHVSRYDNTTEGGRLVWHGGFEMDLEGRHVVLIDDILDQGLTIQALRNWATQRGAEEVTVAVLLDKHSRGDRPAAADFVALACPDRYVFGWGMDFEGYWRNLPDIYALPDGFGLQDSRED